MIEFGVSNTVVVMPEEMHINQSVILKAGLCKEFLGSKFFYPMSGSISVSLSYTLGNVWERFMTVHAAIDTLTFIIAVTSRGILDVWLLHILGSLAGFCIVSSMYLEVLLDFHSLKSHCRVGWECSNFKGNFYELDSSPRMP